MSPTVPQPLLPGDDGAPSAPGQPSELDPVFTEVSVVTDSYTELVVRLPMPKVPHYP